jgi:hypothetical protein
VQLWKVETETCGVADESASVAFDTFDTPPGHASGGVGADSRRFHFGLS